MPHMKVASAEHQVLSSTHVWADAAEVADSLGVSPHTLRRLARQGRSPIIVRKVGGQWRWSRADLERFVAVADVLGDDAREMSA